MSQKLKIAFMADDNNEAVARAKEYLRKNHDVTEIPQSNNWAAIAKEVAKLVAVKEVDYGVLMCWTGTGTAIAANKVKGVRAATVIDAWTARGARLWNDANVIALSHKRLATDVVVECLEAFLSVESPDPDEVENIKMIEEDL